MAGRRLLRRPGPAGALQPVRRRARGHAMAVAPRRAGLSSGSEHGDGDACGDRDQRDGRSRGAGQRHRLGCFPLRHPLQRQGGGDPLAVHGAAPRPRGLDAGRRAAGALHARPALRRNLAPLVDPRRRARGRLARVDVRGRGERFHSCGARSGRSHAHRGGRRPAHPPARVLSFVGSSALPGHARDRAAGGEPRYHGRAMTTPSAPSRALAADVDPVRFEVIRNALLAITEEMGATLRRAAYSTNIKTRGDFSCAFFDRELRTIAQAFAQPSHLGSLAHIVPRAIRAYGADRLAPGDGILINDPYLGGVHLNDITLITPVFHADTVFGYVANIAHHVDVGGGAPGSIGVSSEIYQEGLVIPPVRFVKGGQIDPDIFAVIRSNFRGTREISGDFRAQTAANRLGASRIEALVGQHGAATLSHYLDELLRYTERRTRAAFAEFPDGRFAADMLMDGDGVTDQPVKLAAVVTIEGGRLSVDLTGCDEQRKSPTNATSSQTYSGVVYVLKCLIDPDIPVNDGFYRLIDIRTRPGSVVCAQHPAAVAAGWEIAMQLCDLLFRALAPALPDRVVAGTKGCVCNIAFGGVNPATGEYFTYYETIAGGYGATLTTDGMDAVQAHFQNTENAPVEETEANYPVRIVRYELIDDSEGPGRHRGGLGVRRDYAFPGHAPSFSILSDKTKFPPWGLFGGGAARPAKYILNPDTAGARELALGRPSAAVIASRDDTLAALLQRRLGTREFRLYANRDVVGVELGGALKNVMAIATGIADGLGLGENARAALITRGLA